MASATGPDDSGQIFARAFNGETLFVKQTLDLKNHFHILPPVKAMACSALDGLQGWKFRFPIAQDVRLGIGKLAHFPDAKVKLVRNHNSVG